MHRKRGCPEHKEDSEVVLKTVSQNGSSSSLEAARQDGPLLQHVAPDHETAGQIVLTAVNLGL